MYITSFNWFGSIDMLKFTLSMLFNIFPLVFLYKIWNTSIYYEEPEECHVFDQFERLYTLSKPEYFLGNDKAYNYSGPENEKENAYIGVASCVESSEYF